MISANGGLPAHRYTPEVTQRWPRGSEPASVVSTCIQSYATPLCRAARAAACPTAGSAPSSAAERGCCLGHQPFPVQWPCFEAGQRARTLPAGGAGPAGTLPAGAS